MNKKLVIELLRIIGMCFILFVAVFLIVSGFKTINWLLIMPGMFLGGIIVRLGFKNIKKINFIILTITLIAWVIVTIFEANNGDYITKLTGIRTANTYIGAFFANSFEIGPFLIGYFIYYPLSKLKQKIDKFRVVRKLTKK